jgi:alpha/beta superfamily hydrolase
VNVEIAGPAGPLEGLINESASGKVRAVAVLAHPLPSAGGTLHTKPVFHTAKALARIGCSVLRFNFRAADRSGDEFLAALDFMTSRNPNVTRVWAAGVSFGAWVAMTAGAGDSRVTALIGIAPPVHMYDFSPVIAAAKPVFLIHGEFDELVPLKEVRRFYGRLAEPKELVVIDGADHLFDGKVTEVGDAVEDLLQGYDD